MDFTREQLIQLWGILSNLAQKKTTAKGAYAIVKNKRLLEAEIKSLEETQKNIKYPDELKVFDEKRIDLCKEYCDKNEDGSPKLDGQLFVVTGENKIIFDEKVTSLREEYKDVLSEQQKVDMEFRKFLSESVNLDFHQISIDDMPGDISAAELDILGDMVI